MIPPSLRREAERRLSGARAKKPASGPASKRRQSDELVLHKLELEAQNEELLRAQTELEDANAGLTELFDHLPVATITLDDSMRIVGANFAAASLLGVERRRLLGRSFGSFLAPADAASLQALQARALATSRRCAFEVCIRSSARAPRRLQLLLTVRAARHTRAGRSNRACHCALIDLSDLRDAQEARERAIGELREVRARFDLFSRHLEDVLYIVDGDRRVVYVSAAYEGVWGRPSAAQGGQPGPWPEAVVRDDRDAVERALDELRRGKPLDVEYRIERPDGGVRWIRDRAFPVGATGASGPARFVGIAGDRTKERELAQTLEHAQKLETIGSLSAGLAHDLNNILQVIVGATSLAGDPLVPPHRAKEFLLQAQAVAMRGSELVQRITGFARRDHAPAAPLGLDAAIAGATALLRPLLGDRIRLLVDLRAPAAVVRTQQVQIEQVLLNLAANGRDAMPAGGALTLRTEDAGTTVLIRVSDTGCGMDADTCSRIFSAYFTTKGEGSGTGLGLATVRSVVEQLGGTIGVASTLGQGTTFTIELPTCDLPTPKVNRRARGLATTER